MAWDPQQYLKFSDHRLRPALELLQRIPLENPGVIFDLGCGTGHVTRLIASRWSAARVCGVDNSPAMLAEAAREQAGAGAIRWVEAGIETWEPQEAPDLIYSNATLHWVEGHRTLFPRLASRVANGGCLAVQMPLSWNAPSHRLMRETLADCDGRTLGTAALRQAAARKWVEDAEVYHDLLVGRASQLDIWETEYLQVLEGEDPVLEWVRGTGLRPVLEGLAAPERQLFLDEYRRRLRVAYPRRQDGRTLYPFRRLFFVALI